MAPIIGRGERDKMYLRCEEKNTSLGGDSYFVLERI